METGLGCALALADVLFWIMFSRYELEKPEGQIQEIM